jgi:hypothetical protein
MFGLSDNLPGLGSIFNQAKNFVGGVASQVQ